MNSRSISEEIKRLAAQYQRSPQLSNAHSKADKEISRIYHLIENTKFNAAEGYLLAAQLRDALIQRRHVKDAIAYQNAMRDILTVTAQKLKKVEEKSHAHPSF